MPADRRFHRQIDRVARSLPGARAPLARLTAPGRIWLRLPLAAVFILGGFLGFLPILGFWMLPLGLILLAIDLPRLRAPVGALIVRGRARLRRWRRT